MSTSVSTPVAAPVPAPSNRLLLARLKVLASVVIWGASFVATKIVVGQIQPLTLITLRTLGGALLLFLLMLARKQWTGPVRGSLLRELVALAFIGVAVHLSLQAISLRLTSATNTSWMVSLTPLVISLLAWRVLGETFGRLQAIGFVIALCGALLIVISQAGGLDMLGLPSTNGDLLALSTTVTWAIFSVYSKRTLRHCAPAMLTLYVMALGGLMTVPIFIARQGWQELGNLDTDGWLALGFTLIFVSALAYLFWYDGLAELDASRVGVFLYVEPLVTVVVAAVVLSEPLRPLMLLGGAAILSGVSLVNSRRRA
ncbi:DMT family transporter [Aggregatilinea lenta]|uniref:DMT family transporter n=1 Tax=Aggregatilinea lenta TaxID=913108 RepID=UPI000E5AF57C|nr:DMT family transporter [Aggregatilinea lenta]